MRQTLHSGRQVLRRRAFRRFWLGMLISRAGDAFTLVALSWLVLGIAGPAQLGVVLMCFGLPRIVSGPVAGRLLDGSRPRLLLAADNAARGLLIAAVPVLLWLHRLTVADLYGIAAVSALLSAATEVAESSLVPRLVADDELDAANSLLSANWELAGIAGPAVAGLIVATVGAPLALLLDAGSFAVMTALCLSLPPLHRAASPEQASPEQAGPGQAEPARFHAVYEAAFRDRPGFPGWPRERWISWISDDEEFRPEWTLLATLAGADAGFIAGEAGGWVAQMGVVPAARGKDVGAALLAEAIRRMRAAGETTITLNVNVNNPHPAALYRRLGFARTGRRARYRTGAIRRPGQAAQRQSSMT